MPVLLSYFSLPLVLPRPATPRISDEISGLQIKNSENLRASKVLYLPQVHLLFTCNPHFCAYKCGFPYTYLNAALGEDFDAGVK
jgi:hypothetical protein